MKLKNISMLAISFMALSITSTTFANNGSTDVNDFFKSFDNEEKQVLNDPFDILDKELENLENTIKDVVKKQETTKSKSPAVSNKKKTDKDIKLDKQKADELKEQASQDVIFLRNIPEGTRITINKEFVILPQNKFIIFHEGKRIIENPLSTNPVNSFCYLELKPSGKARVIKEGKVLTVIKNNSEVMTLKNKDDEEEILKTYETKLSVDNKSIKWITCYSASKLIDSDKVKPLTVKDLRTHSNGSFKLEFPAYEEI